MAKPTFKPNPRVEAIFDDLQQFLEFCQNYGYRYTKAISTTSRAMLGNSSTSGTKAKTPKTCGQKMAVDLQDIAHEKALLHGA